MLTSLWSQVLRTRSSFELAGKYLGADVINLSPSGSSMGKGESFRDTLLTLSYMGTDAIVMRHSAEGAPLYATKAVDPIIINAGDGAHEHPTQALLDMYSILETKESIEGLKVVILGDIMHSRVARSNIYGLTKMGAKVTFGWSSYYGISRARKIRCYRTPRYS